MILQSTKIQRVVTARDTAVVVQRTTRSTVVVANRGPRGREGQQGGQGIQGPQGESSDADPGDLTLIFENKLI